MNRWLSRFFSWNINPNLSKNINAEKSMAENDKLSFTNENGKCNIASLNDSNKIA